MPNEACSVWKLASICDLFKGSYRVCVKKKKNIQRTRTAFVDSVTGPGVKTQIGFKGGM